MTSAAGGVTREATSTDLAAEPARTAARAVGARTLWRSGRLEMYREAADGPAFWEALWRENPPLAMRGMRIDPWLRELVLAWLPRDGLVVEAGCGNGNICRTFVNEGFTVEGVDFAEGAIAENRRVDPRGRYRAADVRGLPYGNGALAGYVSLGVVEHFDDGARAAILREAARVLRPGGVAIVSTPAFNALRGARAAVGGYRGGTEGLPFYQYFFSMGELARDVEGAGLRVVARDGYDVYKGLKDTLPLGGLVKKWWPREGAWGRRLHQPWRWVRRGCGHMQVVVARKPG